jgi:hypothetical protein
MVFLEKYLTMKSTVFNEFSFFSSQYVETEPQLPVQKSTRFFYVEGEKMVMFTGADEIVDLLGKVELTSQEMVLVMMSDGSDALLL